MKTARFGIHHLSNLPSSLKFLILSSFLIPFGSFMVLPFVPILLTRHNHMDMAAVGWVLGFASLIQFGGGFIGGVVAERLGLKRTMLLALTVRTLGFALLLASLERADWLIPAVIIIATGAALYLPANKAYIVNAVPVSERPLFLSLSSSALNAGMAMGPLVGGLFLLGNSEVLFWVIFVVFVVLTLAHWAFVDSAAQVSKHPPRAGKVSYLKLMGVPFALNALAFYGYFFFQNYMGPYTTSLHSAGLYGGLLTVNALLVFFGQPLLSKVIAEASYRASMFFSFMMLSLSMYFLSIGSVWALIVGTVMITFAEMVLFLKGDLEILNAVPDKPAFAFGMQRLSAGLGAFVSALIGGALYDYMQNNQQLGTFWSVLAIQALVVAVVVLAVLSFKRKLAVVNSQA